MDQQTSPTASSNDEQLSLKALGLRSGMALQTRRLVEGAQKHESQFYAAIEGKGVMVGALGSEGADTGLQSGDICLVHGFTGLYEFSFISKVLQTFQKPFVYALLVYPSQVEARRVRQAMRTRVSWPASVAVPSTNGRGEDSFAVDLIDLSDSGAMIRSQKPVAAVGQDITLGLAVSVDEDLYELIVSATVCHNNHCANEEGCIVGMAFKGLTSQDKLVLQYALKN